MLRGIRRRPRGAGGHLVVRTRSDKLVAATEGREMIYYEALLLIKKTSQNTVVITSPLCYLQSWLGASKKMSFAARLTIAHSDEFTAKSGSPVAITRWL